MAIVDVQEIIEAGVHFGHRASRWHPKMKPYIFGKRNLIHIIDVRQTVRGLVRASNFLSRMAASGKEAIFVGTKRQAKSLIMREAQRCGMHWVSERWLGGSLTNYHTIRRRLKRLEELEALEADGSIEQYSKKRVSALRRERRKILRNLEGLRNMKQLPGCLVVVDIRRENNAVREARKIGIPVVALVDTDCDPDLADIVIPANDDAYRSIQVLLTVLSDSILAGRKRYDEARAAAEKAAQEERQREKEARAAAQAAARAREAAQAQAREAAAQAKKAAPPAQEAAPPASGPAGAPAAPAAPADGAPTTDAAKPNAPKPAPDAK